MKDFDAIVLGAGPAGSSAAFFLAAAGMRVAIVERSAFPRRKVCGEFVSATTFPVLDAMGVGPALRAAGGPPTRRVGLWAGRSTPTAPMPLAPGEQGWGRTLARATLDPALLAAAQGLGVEVYQPWKAVGLEGGVVTIEAEGRTERLRTPIVVAAHGSWDVGPLPTQPEKRNLRSDILAFKGFFHDATFDDDLMTLLAFPGGYGGMVHRDAETLGLSFCVRRDALARVRERYPAPNAWESLVQAVAEGCRGVASALVGAHLESPAKAAGPLRPGFRPPYEKGVFRVGNAAGEAHPTVAEGISMAIQSGPLLADCLSAGASSERAGDLYARAWRAQFGARIRMADALARLCMGPLAEPLAMPALAAFPGLLTAGAAMTGKTKPLRVALQ